MTQKHRSIALFTIFLIFTFMICAETIESGNLKLEILENSGRFRLFMKNSEGEYVSVFSRRDPRTTSFSIYEDKIFYTLGDTFRYKKKFINSDTGGTFLWTSRSLEIRQSFDLSSDCLKIDFSVKNISTGPLSVGAKFVFDTDFEEEGRFYLKAKSIAMEIDSEFELDDTESLMYWTSGARNEKGSALMSEGTDALPDRIIFSNWDRLDEADLYYTTINGREFNLPPYSINDSAVMYLYSPDDIVPGNTRNYNLVFRPFGAVQDYSEIAYEKINNDVVDEESKEDLLPVSSINESEVENNGKTDETDTGFLTEDKIEHAEDSLREDVENIQHDDINGKSAATEEEINVNEREDNLSQNLEEENIQITEPQEQSDEKKELDTINNVLNIIKELTLLDSINEDNLEDIEELIKILEMLNKNEDQQ